jgi:Cd2+/Zn2+-exporting ATPase
MRSGHTLAQAVIDYATELGVADRYAPAELVEAVAGMGVRGQVAGHDVIVGSHAFSHGGGECAEGLCGDIDAAEEAGYSVVVVQDGETGERCYLNVADQLRAGAAQAVQDLARLGVARTVMLTGDNRVVADRLGALVGIDEVHAGLLPEDKVEAIEALRGRYANVAMVGDGVNDAPAMARAELGIAMGAAGTDTALETADIALMGDDLSRLPFAVALGRATRRIVRANIAFSLGLKALFLILATMGLSTMWMAVLADTGASIAVSLNGLRLLAFRDRADQTPSPAPPAHRDRA